MSESQGQSLPIEIRNVSKSFGDLKLIRDISISVSQGETVGLFGPGGCGKSTVLKLCMGLTLPTSGKILIDGVDLSSLDRRRLRNLRKKMGMVFQYYALFDSLNVAENIGFFLRENSDMDDGKIAARVSELLDLVRLPGIEELMPVELSGGMKKRVGMARALAHKPKILLYDDPTAGLDPVTADAMSELIVETSHKTGVSSIVVSNDMNCVYKVSDRATMLFDGHLVAMGTVEEIQQSDEPHVYQFVNGLEEGPIQYIE